MSILARTLAALLFAGVLAVLAWDRAARWRMREEGRAEARARRPMKKPRRGAGVGND